MKIGVKTYGEVSFLKKFESNVDFFEIMAVQKNNYSFLKELKKPIIIHAQHQAFNVNNADKSKEKINKDSINFAVKIADMAGAEKIILHPGIISDENCSEENSINFIKNLKDNRIIIENLPGKDSLCKTPEETKEFLKKTKKGLCLDINHAIEIAVSMNEDYIEIIKEFIKLKPIHYHIGGQKITANQTHLCLKESDIELEKIMKMIPKNAEITLETEVDVKKTEEDIKIIKKLI